MSGSKVWLPSSPNLQKGVEVINKVDLKKYHLFLNRIVQDMCQNVDSNRPFSAEEEEMLLTSLSVDEKELTLLINTSSIIITQAAFNTVAPDALNASLLNLNVSQDKCQVLTSVWKNNARNLYLKLKNKSIYTRKLEDISWLLNVETSSRDKPLLFEPNAVLQFKLKDDNGTSNLTVNVDEKVLYNLYTTLENIQDSLDSLI